MANILVIDDNATNREYLVTLLSHLDHHLLEATDGESGLVLALAEHPDLIITDIIMPAMDGYEFARQVRADPAIRQTPIILHTASYVIAETRQLASACGVNHILAKPAEPQEVLDMVAAALGAPPVAPLAPPSEEFHQQHIRLITNTLANKVEELEAEIVERKQTEMALRESEERFRATFEQAAVGIAHVDLDGRWLRVNQRLCEIVGYTRADLLARTFQSITHPDDLETNQAGLQQIVAGEIATYAREKRYVRKDGSVVWVNLTVSLVREPSGAPDYFISVIEDITWRKQAEAALRDSEARFRVLFEHSPDAIMLIDPYSSPVIWAILDCNEVAGRMNGYGQDDLIGQSVEILDTDDSTPEAHAEYLERLRQAGTLIYETYHRRRDGSVFPIEVSTSIVNLAGRELILGIDRDITERVQRERELAAIAAVSAALRGARTRAEMLPIILDQLRALLDAEAADLCLLDSTTGEVVVELGQGTWAPLTGQRIRPEEGVSGQIMATGQVYHTDEAASDSNIYPLAVSGGIRSLAGAPLVTHEQSIGVLWVGRQAPIQPSEIRVLTAIADIAANAIHRATLHEQTEQRLERLNSLRIIDRAINASVDLDMVLELLLEQALSQLRVDAASLLMMNVHLQVLEFAAGRGFRGPEIERSRLRVGEGLAGLAALERRRVAVPDLAQAAAEPRGAALAGEGFSAYYAVPLIAKGRVQGVLEVFHRAALRPDHDWLEFLDTLAGQAAIALESAELFTSLQRSNTDLILAYDETIEGWSRALDMRDHETEGHSRRVTDLTLELAQALGAFSDAELVHVRRGALLHDIGKMGIPDSILLKPDKLTSDEWGIMSLHPALAYELLAPITFLRQALDIPYCHHEKWDGSGYPRKLKGEAIPLAARLFAVVDVWDALRSARPYRPAWPEAKVLEHIQALSGSHFEPGVVAAFLKLSLARPGANGQGRADNPAP